MNSEAQKTERLFLYGMIFSMLTWGFSWTSGKIMSNYGTSYAIGFYRFLFTVISLLPILILMKEKLFIQKSGWLLALLAGGLMTTYSYLFLEGLHQGSPGAGGVLVTTLNPILSFLIGLYLDRRLPTKRESLGLLLGTIAALIMLNIWQAGNTLFQSGNLYFILATATWAVLSITTSKSSKHGSTLSFSLWIYSIGTLLMLLFTDNHEIRSVWQDADRQFWINLIFSATITTAVATTYFFYATARIGASRASSFIFLVPLSAGFGAWLILDEPIANHTFVGGGLGIVAVYLLQKKKTIAS